MTDRRRFRKRRVPAANRRLRIEPLEDRRMLAVVTVTTEQDVVDFGDGVTSLREAIFSTNLVEGPDEIVFEFDHDGPATLRLTEGELLITDDLTLTGPGAALLTINASGSDPTPEENNGDGSRIFNVDDGDRHGNIHVVISGMTLTGGDARFSGAISAKEDLTIQDAVIDGNAALFSGGGIGFSSPSFPPRILSLEAQHTTPPLATPTLLLDRVTISNNTTLDGSGGGLNIRGNLTALISESTISNNLSSDGSGGGISIGDVSFVRDDDRTEQVTIIDSIISDNVTAGRSSGGGIYSGRSELTIMNSTISANTTEGIVADGGGIMIREGNALIVGSTINDNSLLGDGAWGGGIQFVGLEPTSSLTLSESTVSGNSTNGGLGTGGGLRVLAHQATISGSTISNNLSSDNGGGIAIFAARDDAEILIQNTTISDNRAADSGGGVYIGTQPPVQISHSTIAFNTSDADMSGEGAGGGVFVANGDVLLDHTIVAGNHDNTGAANDVAGVINANRSLVGFGAKFLAPLADNDGPTQTHALLPGSPALDAGDPELFVDDLGVPLHDQRGAPFTRVAGGRIDIGAYEHQQHFLPGDYNLDGAINTSDYAVWRETLGQTGERMRTDGDGNQRIDHADYLIWHSNFGQSRSGPTPRIQSLQSPLATEQQVDVVPPVPLAWATIAAPAVATTRGAATPLVREAAVDFDNAGRDAALLEHAVSEPASQIAEQEQPTALPHGQPERDLAFALDEASWTITSWPTPPGELFD